MHSSHSHADKRDGVALLTTDDATVLNNPAYGLNSLSMHGVAGAVALMPLTLHMQMDLLFPQRAKEVLAYALGLLHSEVEVPCRCTSHTE